jgi:hypothetical protein
MKKKPVAKKKKNVDVSICLKNHNKRHCFHNELENQNSGWSIMYPPRIWETFCCKCGMNEMDLHGPFHPRKKNTTNTNISNGTSVIVTGNSGTSAGPFVNNNGISITNVDAQSTPTTDIRTTVEQLKHIAFGCSDDCGCNKKEVIVIKKPKTT